MGEELVSGVTYDVEKISERFGKKPTKVYVYVAAPWKRGVYTEMREKKDMRSAIEWAKANEVEMSKVPGFAKSLMKKMHALGPILNAEQELTALTDAQEFLAKEIGAEVVIGPEVGAEHQKASSASPGKPAIILE